MLKGVLHTAFTELFLQSVSLAVSAFHTPAVACDEKAGFVKEWLLRKLKIRAAACGK